MPKKRSSPVGTGGLPMEQAPTNAKVCEQCGLTNSFKRVKCEACGALLPEGKFERARRMREQALRRERQLALNSTLFRDRPLVPDDDTAELEPAIKGILGGKKDDDTVADADEPDPPPPPDDDDDGVEAD